MIQDSDFVKIRVIVPVEHAEKMREVLGKSGAGVQGLYEFASGSWKQTGRFKPMPGAKPAIGKTGELEEVQEEVIETLCHKDKIKEVIEAVKRIHPYEEPAIDIIARLDVM